MSVHWLFALTATLAVGALAEEASPPPEDPRLERIEVQGNTRTQDLVILRALRITPGDAIKPEMQGELRRRLLNLKLFKSVEVLTQPGSAGVVLQVVVEERWTLLPVPFFSSAKNRWQVGIFALESNLFGLNKLLVAGGVLSNRGGSAFALYKDPSILGSRWTGDLSFLFSRADRERYKEDAIADSYEDQRLDLGAVLGYQLTPELNAGAGVFSLTNRPSLREGYTLSPSRSEVHGVTVAAEYQGQDFHFYFNEGLSARVRYREGLDFLGSSRSLRQLSLGASYTQALFKDHSLTLTGAYERSKGEPTLDAVLLGGRTGSRGFVNAGLWAEEAGTFTVEYQAPLWSPRFATFTAHAFVDVGAVRWNSHPTRYVAPGVGLRAYLRNLAIPAVGVEVTRSAETGKLVPSVAVGFAM
ncbi:BamA/TamA family outer membrane protein [Stigmatella sp. ncwal1]|uniref:BamA/TamA family outer membrane protein n=1 Tax=Stigmatella ashevillensis TaxID=2995309 RepID=A0ABT5D401_9BACT|nr:BamA/TamA family outer membrane protein [Stigmatella ashevillena]MDC0707863.1 BamA/TamA family outer membrane protein [Stigmatella ashevillena]